MQLSLAGSLIAGPKFDEPDTVPSKGPHGLDLDGLAFFLRRRHSRSVCADYMCPKRVRRVCAPSVRAESVP